MFLLKQLGDCIATYDVIMMQHGRV